MTGVRAVLRSRDGNMLALMLVVLTALMGMGALAVDMGMLYAARLEAQRAADAAALAGVSAFMNGPGGTAPDSARVRALDYATRNHIVRTPVAADDVAVQVVTDSSLVRVTVRSRNLPTWLARVLGIQSSRVAARATASADGAQQATCIKPFTAPDPLATPVLGRDFEPGEQIMVKGHGKFKVGKSLFDAYVWDMPHDPEMVDQCRYTVDEDDRGNRNFRGYICSCNMVTISLAEEYPILRGGRSGSTERGVTALIERDPAATWDPGSNTVVNSAYTPWRRSPRVVRIPLHDPIPTAISETFRPTRFVDVFIESVSDKGGVVEGRYVDVARAPRLTG